MLEGLVQNRSTGGSNARNYRMSGSWRWNRRRAFDVVRRRNKINGKIHRREFMNNFVYPLSVSPFLILFFVFWPIFKFSELILRYRIVRKQLAMAIAGVAGVFGVYWVDIFGSPEILEQISYSAYFHSKYVITGFIFAFAYRLSSLLDQD
jgi:hypothetical protein